MSYAAGLGKGEGTIRAGGCFSYMTQATTAYEPGSKPVEKSTEEAENTDATLRVANEDTAAPVSEKRTTEEVRQGHTGDHVRYILMASIAGIAFVFAILLALYVF